MKSKQIGERVQLSVLLFAVLVMLSGTVALAQRKIGDCVIRPGTLCSDSDFRGADLQRTDLSG
ncbi:MAG: hypothetical protein ACRECQ_08645, partial [Burkholderiaceae bacterium]